MGLMPEMSAGQAAVVSILLWWATNIFTVIANKWIFQILQFAYPLTLTGVRASPRTHARTWSCTRRGTHGDGGASLRRCTCWCAASEPGSLCVYEAGTLQ